LPLPSVRGPLLPEVHPWAVDVLRGHVHQDPKCLAVDSEVPGGLGCAAPAHEHRRHPTAALDRGVHGLWLLAVGFDLGTGGLSLHKCSYRSQPKN